MWLKLRNINKWAVLWEKEVKPPQEQVEKVNLRVQKARLSTFMTFMALRALRALGRVQAAPAEEPAPELPGRFREAFR